jgi:hypothetical protein
MYVSKDALWKGIIENFWHDFILFFFPELTDEIDFERGFEFMDTELQKLLPDNPGSRRHADKLVKVWLKTGEEFWFLIHVEIQGYQDKLIGRRTYECYYRIKDRFGAKVACLVVYTDWNRKYHLKQYREDFLDTSLTFKFKTYVLRDHSPSELAQNPNLFAAIMEAAWQHFIHPKDDLKLKDAKLDLVRRLLMRKIPKEKIRIIIDFIRLYTPFTNSNISTNFEEELIDLTKSDVPMGFEEAVLADVKNQGIEEGIEIGREEGREEGIELGIELGKKELILKLWDIQEMSFEKIAMLVDYEKETVQKIVKIDLIDQGFSEEDALVKIDDYSQKWA